MKKYLKIFLAALLIYAAGMLFILIPTKGAWVYYGDFNVQQIPFYVHAHDAIRNGNFFYDFSTDLGGSLIGCYSFYLLGSPFFWLTLPFDSSLITYLMPILTCLKYATMALTSFAYMRRHTKTDTGAYIGALLYTFSGYQGAVLAYNHFHDVVAFFPLFLLLFELALETGRRKYRVGFTLMTAFMVCLNYYFFVGEVVFLVIYFCCKFLTAKESIWEKVKKALMSVLMGGTGVLLSGAFFLPAIYYTLGNSRLGETLNGYSLVAYDDSITIWGIIKNTVMLTDLSGLNSMLNPDSARVSGIGAYLPLVSIAAVYAYMKNNRKDFKKNIIVVSIVCAVIPVLNSVFSAFNSEYYARWFFMPVMFMALMTANVFEEPAENLPELKKGAWICGAVTVIICLMSILPAKDSEGNATLLGNLKNPEQLIEEEIFSVLMCILLILFLYILLPKLLNKEQKVYEKVLREIITGACFVTAVTMLVAGSFLIELNRKTSFLEQAVHGESPLEDEDSFYRIETEGDVYNYPMFWNRPSITSFISTIPNSTLDFYHEIGIGRKVTSDIHITRIGARTLLSAKYYLVEKSTPIEHISRVEEGEAITAYEKVGEKSGFEIWENPYYLPMGFTFDDCISESSYKEITASSGTLDRFLLKALIVPDDVIDSVSSYMNVMEADDVKSISLSYTESLANARRKHTCDSFETSTRGFRATIDMENENVLFFSVPYEKGFTAYVDGNETSIIKCDFGLMGIVVPEGYHEIVFDYLPSYYKEGLYMSLAGVILLIAIIAIKSRKKIVDEL